MTNIESLIQSGASVQVQVAAEDLKAWAFDLLNQFAISQAKPKEESYLTAAQASRFLKVDKSTLWRWKKEHYLVPVAIGNRNRYKLSELEELKNRRP